MGIRWGMLKHNNLIARGKESIAKSFPWKYIPLGAYVHLNQSILNTFPWLSLSGY